MSKKSRHDELQNMAVGSDALYGGMTESNDILAGVCAVVGVCGRGGDRGNNPFLYCLS